MFKIRNLIYNVCIGPFNGNERGDMQALDRTTTCPSVLELDIVGEMETYFQNNQQGKVMEHE